MRKCDGWKDEATDLAVTIGADGKLTDFAFWSVEAEPALIECVRTVLSAQTYRPGRDRTTLAAVEEDYMTAAREAGLISE